MRAIRRPDYCVHICWPWKTPPPMFMFVLISAMMGSDIFSTGGVPDLRCSIFTCRSNPHTIRRPGNSIHKIRMTMIGGKKGFSENVPDLYQFASIIHRDDTRTIRQPLENTDFTIMTPIGMESCSQRRFFN